MEVRPIVYSLKSGTNSFVNRGASRYYDPNYRDGFALECAGVKVVREEFGLTNLDVMVPFCRTVEEARKVIAEMEKNGLKRGSDDEKDRMRIMCTSPWSAQ